MGLVSFTNYRRVLMPKPCTTDTIMEVFIREATKKVRKEQTTELIKLKKQQIIDSRELKRLTKIEKELIKEKEKLKPQQKHLDVIARKIIRGYDDLKKIKTRQVGTIMNDSAPFWSQVTKEHAAIRVLRKQINKLDKSNA